MLEGKKLINGIASLHVADAAITEIGINNFGATELNPMGYNEKTLLIKAAAIIFLIALYALAKEKDHKYTWSIEKALQIGVIITMVVVESNTVMVGVELIH